MSENDLDMDLDELALLEDPMDAEEMHSRLDLGKSHRIMLTEGKGTYEGLRTRRVKLGDYM